VFVGLIAPAVFDDFYELELGALATFVLLLWAARRSAFVAWRRSERLLLFLGAGVCLPLLASSLLVREQAETRQGRVLWKGRSFLGPLRVVQLLDGRLLTHGRIQHGFQFDDPGRKHAPTLYFGHDTALGRVLDTHHRERGRRIGVVGLGVGTIASYGRAGDTIRFYEIDRQVVEIAQRDFSFLADSAAEIQVVVGDGRLSLQREPSHAFDVLVLDAFTSDSVPVHLLTSEAFAHYTRQLAPDGVLLANVSNRYLSVDRVVSGSAKSVGFACVLNESPSDDTHHLAHAEWALLARDASLVAELSRGLSLRPAPGADASWTDKRASVFSILR
jgi:protein-L-isoaspartate O-methyltransferase